MITGVFGGVGDGKTILNTVMTLDIAHTRDDYEIYANYTIHNPKVKRITPLEMLDINPEENRALINLDEAYAWLESRMSLSSLNKIMSWIVFQHRKRNMDILYTAQLTSSVDIRLRGLTDIAYVCERVISGFKYKYYWQRGLRIHRRRQFLPLEKAKKYFPLYDTREIIEPAWIEKIKRDLETENQQPIDLEKEIEETATQIRGLLPKGLRITRSAIDYFLLKIGKPLKYADLILMDFKIKGMGKTWILE